jgi:GNAT superfamily N-acetyltransferase
MRIRPAEPADVPGLLALIRDLAVYERLQDQMVATEALLTEHLFGARPSAEALIADADDGEPAGYALFFTTFSTFAGRPGIWLEDLFVRPAHRRNGLGRALLAAVAAVAAERDCARLEWSALDWNEPALAFYRSIGVRALPEWVWHRVEGPAIRRLVEDG